MQDSSNACNLNAYIGYTSWSLICRDTRHKKTTCSVLLNSFGLHGLIHHRVLKAVPQVKKVRLEIVIAIIKLLIFQIAMALTPEIRNAIPKDVVS